ncbi:Cytochrome P450 [Corchorus olitorius]|uniref:Cytochrome P450 n=1 Tax=Corchorus olitorius TaxID=93759 RepID=A0A1R3HXG3_9ROSI|nr:Cytochrome P450 [Corchorus olitorius]
MDFSNSFPAIPTLVGATLTIPLFLLSLLWILKRVSTNTNQNLKAPEAGGAWPVIGHLHLLGGSKPLHIILANMADKYGPIFTIKLGMRRALIVSNSETAKECFTTNDKAFATRPKVAATMHMCYNNAMIGFAPYGPYWRQVRKLATLQLLSNNRLDMLKHVRESEVKLLLQELYQKWNRGKNRGDDKVLVEMNRWFWDLIFNMNLRMIVGKRISSDADQTDRFKKVLKEFIESVGKFVTSDALPFLEWFDKGGDLRAMKKVGEEIDLLAEEWLQEHKRKKASADDFNGGGGGGEDFMDVMLSNFTDVGEHDADTINKATCLVSIEDCMVSGYRVPEGTWLIPNLYKIHRDPTIWPDPSEFRPERFLTTHSHIDVRGQNFELIPFSSGRRICPGISFALQILQLTLANLLQWFELGTPGDEPIDMEQGIGLTLTKSNPLEVLIRPRLPSSLYESMG